MGETSELITTVAAIFAAGLFWSAIVFWAVKTMLGRHFQNVEKHLETTVDALKTAIKTLATDHTEHHSRINMLDQRVQKLDLEMVKVRKDVATEMTEKYVHRREMDEIKLWFKRLADKIDKLHDHPALNGGRQP